MRYGNLGRSDMRVSNIGLGCMGFTKEKEEQSRDAVLRALEVGITLFDTADVYQGGVSEIVLGKALRESGVPREDYVIATKCGTVKPGVNSPSGHKSFNASETYVNRSCEESLRRLGAEYIDIYQIHQMDFLTHPEETARALENLQRSGKIKQAGVSNYTPEALRALLAYMRVQCLQTRFSLLHSVPLQTGLYAACAQHGLTTLCWAPLHKGTLALSGGSLPAQGNQHSQPSAFAPLVEKYALSPSQLSLAWLLQLPAVVPLVGTTNPDHIAEAAAAVETGITRDDWYSLLVIGSGKKIPWL